MGAASSRRGDVTEGSEAIQNRILDLAKGGHFQQVEEQLQVYPSFVNARPSYRGFGILHQAAYFGEEQVVAKLLKCRADPLLLSNDGRTAADVAKERGHMDVHTLLQQPVTESSEAIQNRILDLAKGGHFQQVEEQLQVYPSFVNARPSYRGFGILHQAAYFGEEQVVARLLKCRADPLLLSNGGKTAADVAKEHGHMGVHSLLQQTLLDAPSQVELHVLNVAGEPVLENELIGAHQTIGDVKLLIQNATGEPIAQQTLTSLTAPTSEPPTETEQLGSFVSADSNVVWLQLIRRLKMMRELFAHEPATWGLRGDPHLWVEMKTTLAQEPCPSTDSDLIKKLEDAFTSLTGAVLPATISPGVSECVWVERFNHGGMSGGSISYEFWRNRVIPALCLINQGSDAQSLLS